MKLFYSKFFAIIAAVVLIAQLGATWAPTTFVSSDPSTQHTHTHSTSDSSILELAESVSKIDLPFFQQTDSKPKKVDPLVFWQAERKLWEDHITWTRVYIISALAGLPEADAAAGRLLQNQVDIGNAIKPFYGDQAGEQLTSLLNEHILIAVDLLAAAKAGDTAGFNDANERWYDNANQIAAFLNTANPRHWPLEDMQAMMKTHLDLTLEEAVARLNGDWAGDVVAYDKVHHEILQMAGMLTEGIVAQFPKRFK